MFFLECDESSEFTCNDGTCIPDYQRCNNDVDCNYGEDEENCRKFIRILETLILNFDTF